VALGKRELGTRPVDQTYTDMLTQVIGAIETIPPIYSGMPQIARFTTERKPTIALRLA